MVKPLQQQQQQQQPPQPQPVSDFSAYVTPNLGLQQAATPTSIRPEYISPNQLSPLGKMQVNSFKKMYTVNRERFAGPNFRGFEEDHESFSVNILHERLFNNYLYNISTPGQ